MSLSEVAKAEEQTTTQVSQQTPELAVGVAKSRPAPQKPALKVVREIQN